MRRTLAASLFVCVLCLFSVTSTQAQNSRPASTITIAAYNVRNLFDRYDNPYTADEGTKPKSERELNALISGIKQIDADVMFIEEVEYGGALIQLAKDRLPEYPYVIDNPTTDPRGISVGVISKLPILQIVSHRMAPLTPDGGNKPTNRFARDLLRVDLQPQPDFKLSLYGVHLKSKRDSENDPKSARWRLAEAEKIAEILRDDQAAGIKNFAILGDFNDTADSPPLKTIMSALPQGKLTDVLDHIPADQRITYEDSRFREAIDFILLSPELAKKMTPKSGMIFQGEPFTRASDHRPVRVIINLSR